VDSRIENTVLLCELIIHRDSAGKTSTRARLRCFDAELCFLERNMKRTEIGSEAIGEITVEFAPRVRLPKRNLFQDWIQCFECRDRAIGKDDVVIDKEGGDEELAGGLHD